MVDLAGSEDVRKSKVGGQQLKEAANINKSLHQLTLCIKALTAKPKTEHVPYRDSSLTKILSQSLGGTARCAMIANISAKESNTLTLTLTVTLIPLQITLTRTRTLSPTLTTTLTLTQGEQQRRNPLDAPDGLHRRDGGQQTRQE